jgi:hypothetical protein
MAWWCPHTMKFAGRRTAPATTDVHHASYCLAAGWKMVFQSSFMLTTVGPARAPRRAGRSMTCGRRSTHAGIRGTLPWPHWVYNWTLVLCCAKMDSQVGSTDGPSTWVMAMSWALPPSLLSRLSPQAKPSPPQVLTWGLPVMRAGSGRRVLYPPTLGCGIIRVWCASASETMPAQVPRTPAQNAST